MYVIWISFFVLVHKLGDNLSTCLTLMPCPRIKRWHYLC